MENTEPQTNQWKWPKMVTLCIFIKQIETLALSTLFWDDVSMMSSEGPRYGQVTWQLIGRWSGTGHGDRAWTQNGEVAAMWTSGGGTEVTSQMTWSWCHNGRWFMVCASTTFQHGQYWGRGHRTHREDDTWQGYGREIAHPPDVNLRRIKARNWPPNLGSGALEIGRLAERSG